MEKQSQATASNGKKPDFRLYVVTGDGKDATWLAIGAAWLHGDGNGFNLALDALPLTGRLVMRAPLEKPEDGGQ